MRRMVRATTAAVVAVGMMGSTAAVAAPVSGTNGGGATAGAVVLATPYPWICRVFPNLPIC